MLRWTAVDVEARFWAKVKKTPEGCWLWTGYIQPNGYGQFDHGLAHRWAYEAFVGPIPEGYQIDHVKDRGCTSRACVRPDHLEPVTLAENIRRGQTGKVNNHQTRKTACPRGHAYDEANTYRYANGRRECRACRNTRGRARRAARRSA